MLSFRPVSAGDNRAARWNAHSRFALTRVQERSLDDQQLA
jgi:hypothetical protein